MQPESPINLSAKILRSIQFNSARNLRNFYCAGRPANADHREKRQEQKKNVNLIFDDKHDTSSLTFAMNSKSLINEFYFSNIAFHLNQRVSSPFLCSPLRLPAAYSVSFCSSETPQMTRCQSARAHARPPGRLKEMFHRRELALTLDCFIRAKIDLVSLRD